MTIKRSSYSEEEEKAHQIKKHIEEGGNIRTIPYRPSEIKILDLDGTNLETLPENIDQLESLTDLRLSENNLTSLPESIGRLTKLEYFTCDHNKLSDLPESIGNLKELTELQLFSNSLRELTRRIGNLTNLEALHLDNNQLSILPESVSSLTKLKLLYIHQNEFSFLPESIPNLKELNTLNIAGNKLTALPNSIGELTNLTKLTLAGNKGLTALPQSIGKLTALQKLNVAETSLTALPGEIVNLTILKSLILYGNEKLTQLPPFVFYNLTCLIELNIKKCTHLTSLPCDLFTTKDKETKLEINPEATPLLQPIELPEDEQHKDGTLERVVCRTGELTRNKCTHLTSLIYNFFKPKDKKTRLKINAEATPLLQTIELPEDEQHKDGTLERVVCRTGELTHNSVILFGLSKETTYELRYTKQDSFPH
jgi:Leucine-rich repeat (LRR) protein